MTTPNEYPTMFRYLLQMHKDGKVLMELAMNVPIDAFPSVKMQSLLSLEDMLVSYGKEQGFTKTMGECALTARMGTG